MEALTFLEAFASMCNSKDECEDCALHSPASHLGMSCSEFLRAQPRTVVYHIERWAKEHQAVVPTDTPDQPTPSVAVGRGEILDKARGCVCKDRNREYGEPEDGFKLIAALWEPVIRESCVSPGADVSVLPETVALLMALLKAARAATNPGHLDSWIDLAGYAACGGEIACKEDGSD